MIVRTRTTALLVIATLLLAGCAGGDTTAAPSPEGAGVSEATFVAVDIDWQEAPEELAAGEVTVVLDNQGSIEHTLAFDEINGGETILAAQGGETVEGTVTLEPGTYTYFCDVPGHREAGMEGTLQVS